MNGGRFCHHLKYGYFVEERNWEKDEKVGEKEGRSKIDKGE